jgi:hypothetical protein
MGLHRGGDMNSSRKAHAKHHNNTSVSVDLLISGANGKGVFMEMLALRVHVSWDFCSVRTVFMQGWTSPRRPQSKHTNETRKLVIVRPCLPCANSFYMFFLFVRESARLHLVAIVSSVSLPTSNIRSTAGWRRLVLMRLTLASGIPATELSEPEFQSWKWLWNLRLRWPRVVR